MNAEIISVGTELLLGSTVDTNAAAMGVLLAECGVGCTHRQTVGDNLDRLTEALRLSLSRADVVVTIGGLGPTLDDLTRDGIALALDDPLVLDPDLEVSIREIFSARNLKWVESNARQAMRPSCAVALQNDFGTAPGLWCEKDGKIVIALPGPPREFNPMAQAVVRERLAARAGGGTIFSRVLRVCGLGESRVEELTQDLMDTSNPTLAPYAKTWEVHLRLTARAGSVEEAQTMLAPLEAAVRERLGWHVYGVDETELEDVVIKALISRGQTVAVAESCTGGLLGGRLTGTPGSSAAFVGGVIAYTEEVKMRELGVSAESISTHSTVSEEVAREMALGTRKKFGSDFALSVTGVAGPGEDAAGNPEGLVYIGLANGDKVEVSEQRLGRGRSSIRVRATQSALTLLWARLQGN